MRVHFTNTDSTGAPAVSAMAVTLGGERHEIDVAGTGTAVVPEAIGEYLIESPNYQVEPHESADNDGDSNGDADADATTTED